MVGRRGGPGQESSGRTLPVRPWCGIVRRMSDARKKRARRKVQAGATHDIRFRVTEAELEALRALVSDWTDKRIVGGVRPQESAAMYLRTMVRERAAAAGLTVDE